MTAVEFNKSEIQELQDAFCFHDRSGVGGGVYTRTLPRDKLLQAFRSLGQNISGTALDSYMLATGAGQDGRQVTFEDFVAMMKLQVMNQRTRAQITADLEALDKQGNGKVHVKELEHVLMSLCDKLPPNVCSHFLSFTNEDKDGYFEIAEFVKAIN